MEGWCRVCVEFGEVKHLPLYVSGSEGVELCNDCEMIVVDLVRSMIRTTAKSRLIFAKDLKRIREAKDEASKMQKEEVPQRSKPE